MDHMIPNELDDPRAIDFKAKERISRAAGKPVEEVARMLTFFNQSLILQQWLTLKSVRFTVFLAFSHRLFVCFEQKRPWREAAGDRGRDAGHAGQRHPHAQHRHEAVRPFACFRVALL